jgi:hypothetical protein
MRRAICLAAGASLIFTVQTFAAGDDPVSGFLIGLKSILSSYDDLQNWIVTSHIPQIEKRQLAGKMYRLADTFSQLKHDKAGLTAIISTPPISEVTLTQQIEQSNRTINCLRANLDDLELQIKNQVSINGPKVETNLSEGLDQKTASLKQVKEIARNLGLETENEADALQKIKMESQKSEQLAAQLVNASLDFARSLDPSSSPPLEHRPCVAPQAPR